MKVELVRIGNSRGVRIPKSIIEQCGFGAKVDLRIERDRLVITPQRVPREGWAEDFKAAGHARDDELLLDTAVQNDFNREEWHW